MLNSYVQRIKDALASYPWIESVEFLRFDLTRTDLERILLYSVRVRLQDGELLEACERLFYLEKVEEIKGADANVHTGRRLHAKRVDSAHQLSALKIAQAQLVNYGIVVPLEVGPLFFCQI